MRNLLLSCACAIACAFAASASIGQALPEPVAEAPYDAANISVAAARQVADTAAQPTPPWSGPHNGPRAQPGKYIAIDAEDLRNGGILGVVDGVVDAAKVIGWNVKIFNSEGQPDLRLKTLANAFASRPDGLIVVGGDAQALLPGLQPFAGRKLPIVGWHVAPQAGPVRGTPVAMNVSTDPREVARVTALAAIAQSGGHPGVVIFTDSNFRVAQDKADAMAAVVRACKQCRLLEVRDVPISRSEQLMPATTRELLARYGKRWSCALAINDIYFDYAVPVLTQAGLPTSAMVMLSAGDGSESAFLRVRTGTFQTGTVAEPLSLQGWQLVDEMNRLLAGEHVTDYVFPVHLVTAANVTADGGERLVYDPANGYRDIYRRIWQRP
ncbi:substrate-binding domain-containing protein [Paraburkholderia sp. EG287B]|uniref:substrate-binding domain-containing protein n=1 Tax=Paraburkholderia sp. EG287B TaxID=3237010 RepID=UPI0034D1CDBD